MRNSNMVPRVKIAYDVETGGAIEKRELPFIIGILADLAPGAQSRIPLQDRSWHQVDRDTLSSLRKQFDAEATGPARPGWIGLEYLLTNADTNSMLQVMVLDITKSELAADLAKAAEPDQSVLFKKLYENTYGSLGGSPFSLLVGDYYFTHSSNDVQVLQQLAALAAAVHAPFIGGADAALFNLESFKDLNRPRSLGKIFDLVDFADYLGFRQTEDARYISLVLPRVLVDVNTSAADAETTTVFDASEIAARCTWANPVYFLAERIANAFSTYSWPVAFTGEVSGKVALPVFSFHDAVKTMQPIGPTEVSINMARGQELAGLGFIPLCTNYGNEAVFYNAPSLDQPKQYFDATATSNAVLSSQLPYLLAASRFAQYIKVIMRDKIGSFLTRGNVESYLNSWIASYVLLDDSANDTVKAAYPLRSANIVVTDVPGQPGCYNAVIFIKPHFQLEALTTSIRLVAALPA